MNNKGFLFGGIATVPSILITIALLNIGISQLPGVKTSFRERKAISMCEAEGKAPHCTEAIKTLTKAQILEYIRDDDLSTGNKGYIN